MHIIETDDGKFMVREFTFPLWGYVDRNDDYVWRTWDYAVKYCAVDTEEKAREVAKKRKKNKKIMRRIRI